MLPALPAVRFVLILWLSQWQWQWRCGMRNVAAATSSTTHAAFVTSSQPAAQIVADKAQTNSNCNVKNSANTTTTETTNSDAVNSVPGKVLSRRKRFLAFPLGSSFSTAFCMTSGVLGNPNYQYLSMGLNWGFAYDLPNATWVFTHANALGNRKPKDEGADSDAGDSGTVNVDDNSSTDSIEKSKIKRRQRRELYRKVETVINSNQRQGQQQGLQNNTDDSKYKNNIRSHTSKNGVVIADAGIGNYDDNYTYNAGGGRATLAANSAPAAMDFLRINQNIRGNRPKGKKQTDLIASAPEAPDEAISNAENCTEAINITSDADYIQTNNAQQNSSTTNRNVCVAPPYTTAVTTSSLINVISAIKLPAMQFAASSTAPPAEAEADTVIASPTAGTTWPPKTTAMQVRAAHDLSLSPNVAPRCNAMMRARAAANRAGVSLGTSAAKVVTSSIVSATKAKKSTPPASSVTLTAKDPATSVLSGAFRATAATAAMMQSDAARANRQGRTLSMMRQLAASKQETQPPAKARSLSATAVRYAKQSSTLTATTAPMKSTATAKSLRTLWKAASKATPTRPQTSTYATAASAAFTCSTTNATSSPAVLTNAVGATAAPSPILSLTSATAASYPTASSGLLSFISLPASSFRSPTHSSPSWTSSGASTTITTIRPRTSLQRRYQRILSRPKRYLAFPEGSSFSVALCITVGIVGNPRYDYMSFGLNWGVSYDLPNATWVLLNLHALARHPPPTAVLRRRTHRALYAHIEHAVDNMGYNGRDCVLRALCESRQYFARNKLSMIGEMLRVVFSLPKQRVFTREIHENADILTYDRAYRKARDVDCESQYNCGFSLLELAFGKYSTPPPGYYEPIGM